MTLTIDILDGGVALTAHTYILNEHTIKLLST